MRARIYACDLLTQATQPGHVLTNMTQRRHLEAHACASPVGGMYHWNHMAVAPIPDESMTTFKTRLQDPAQPPQRSPSVIMDASDVASERSHASTRAGSVATARLAGRQGGVGGSSASTVSSPSCFSSSPRRTPLASPRAAAGLSAGHGREARQEASDAEVARESLSVAQELVREARESARQAREFAEAAKQSANSAKTVAWASSAQSAAASPRFAPAAPVPPPDASPATSAAASPRRLSTAFLAAAAPRGAAAGGPSPRNSNQGAMPQQTKPGAATSPGIFLQRMLQADRTFNARAGPASPSPRPARPEATPAADAVGGVAAGGRGASPRLSLATVRPATARYARTSPAVPAAPGGAVGLGERGFARSLGPGGALGVSAAAEHVTTPLHVPRQALVSPRRLESPLSPGGDGRLSTGWKNRRRRRGKVVVEMGKENFHQRSGVGAQPYLVRVDLRTP